MSKFSLLLSFFILSFFIIASISAQTSFNLAEKLKAQIGILSFVLPESSAAYVGFGRITRGAMSCPDTPQTYHVTSLNSSGAGTLRDAVSRDCRHIVFDIAGEIDLDDLQISNSYLTIDGATAPSPGITLVNVGRLVLEASGGVAVHDVIVNNIRAIGRGGEEETHDLWELDGSSGAPIYNIVLDHLTMQASADGNVDIYGDVYNVTLSNSLIFDSIQGHHFSDSDGLRERITIYNNVYALNNERQPRVRYDTRQLDFVGNVIYGWGWIEGGAAGMHLDIGPYPASANVENNIYLYVPNLNGEADDALKIDDLSGNWYFASNVWPSGESTGDNATNSAPVSMVYQGVNYSAPRQTVDVTTAGTHYPTGTEQTLLTEIAGAVSALGPL
jgi:pectate lyase